MTDTQRAGRLTENGTGRADRSATRREFLGAAASLSSVPIPREFAFEGAGGDVAVARPGPVDATLGPLSASAFVERYTDEGGVRVRSHAGQPAIPLELIVDTGWSEAALGLEPAEARRIARWLLAAARACEGSRG